jgi:hypothetical protein
VWESWQRVGGRVLSRTGPTAAYLTGNGHIYVGVVGTDGQMYLKVANLTGGFFSIGGRLTSGLAASSGIGAGKTTTYTFGPGTDNQVYEKVGSWASYPPSFSGWTQQTG